MSTSVMHHDTELMALLDPYSDTKKDPREPRLITKMGPRKTKIEAIWPTSLQAHARAMRDACEKNSANLLLPWFSLVISWLLLGSALVPSW